MRMDNRNYNQDRAHTTNWLEMLHKTLHLNPGQYISSKIICDHLLQLWWTCRYEVTTQIIYLPFDTVHYASILGETGRKRTKEDTFEGKGLNRTLASVVPYVKHRKVCFFLHRNQLNLQNNIKSLENSNHYFAVVFDYHNREAHVFGALDDNQPNIRIGNEAPHDWAAWLGPLLWMYIGKWLDWHQLIEDPATVTVVHKTWRQASRNIVGPLEPQRLNS